jgi:protein-tyrosine phosphatase
MTTPDLEQLAKFGIRHVFDLRSNVERRIHPSQLSDFNDISYRFVDRDEIPGDITKILRKSDTQPEESKSLMKLLYRRLPFDFQDAYRALFELLEKGDLPLIFNCTAGKDRTGVAAALILSALGVRREEIFEDYLLSQACFDQSCNIVLRGPLGNLFAGVDRVIWEPIMRVDATYLGAMFEEIDHLFGSIDQYLTRVLRVSDASRERIRSNLLD